MGTISPQQTKSLTEALQAARAQRQQSEVENFVRNGNFYDSPADRNREMLSNLILNRDVFSQSLGNSLVRTRSELGIAPDFGQSKYDKYAQVLSDMQNPTDLRAYYQPTALKMTNGVLGAITTTATTFLQPFADIASLVYIFNPGLNDPNTDWTGTSRLNSFLNNPIQQSLRNVEKVFADIAPIYRYEAERDPNLNLFQRMSYSGWWAEDFIKNIGFTVGAALGGKAMGSGLDFVFNRINTGIVRTVNPAARELFKNTARALGKAGAEGDNIDNLVKILRSSNLAEKQHLIDQLLRSRKVANISTTMIGMITGAGTEAHIEALQARENFIADSRAHIDQFYSVGSMGAKLEYETALQKGTIPQGTTFQQYCQMQKEKAYDFIEKNGNRVMSSVYFLESALLFATNAIAWRDFYDTSFHVQRNQLREHGTFLKNYGGRHRGNIQDVTERKNRLGAASRYLRGIVTEGGEEMAQSGIVEGVSQYIGAKTNQLYRDNLIATDPEYEQRTIGMLNAAWDGLQHMLGTHDSWTEGFVGGVMGAIGLPGRTMTRAQRKAEGISLFNRKAWEMKGGVFEAYRQNEMDRNFAREFVTKVQDVFKNGSTPNQILQQFVAMESHLDLQRLALLDPDKQAYLKQKGEQFKNVLEIYRLTGNMRDLQDMYENIMSITLRSENDPITEEQQAIIDLVKNAFNPNEENFPISDAEILRHIYKNASDHKQAMENYLDITTKINKLINVYENQLTPEEAQQAASLLTDALYKIHMNDKRINDIRSKTDKDGNALYSNEQFERWTQLMLEDSNANLYFDNETVLDDVGNPIKRSAVRHDVILGLANKLRSTDGQGELQYLTKEQLADANTIAEDVVDAYGMNRDNGEYTKAYAQLLTNIVSEVRRYNQLKQKVKDEKEQRELQSYYDQVKQIFDSLKGKKVTEYNEQEVAQKLRPLLNKLHEYSPDKLFKELRSYAEKFTNGYENFNAFYYFHQLTGLSDAKNNDITKNLRDKISTELYQELLDLLPARVAPRIQELLADPNTDSNTRTALSDFVKNMSTKHWYRSQNQNDKLGRTATPRTAASADDFASGTRFNLSQTDTEGGVINTQSKVQVSSIDDAGKQLIDAIETAPEILFRTYVKPDAKYDSQAHTFSLSYTFDGSKLQRKLPQTEQNDWYQKAPIAFGTMRATLNFDTKKVTIDIIPRNSTTPVLTEQFDYFQKNNEIYDTVLRRVETNTAMQEEMKKYPERGREIKFYYSGLLKSFLMDDEFAHFVFDISRRETNGNYQGSITLDERVSLATKLNAICEATMNEQFETGTPASNETNAPQQDEVVTHTNGYRYYQSSIRTLEILNERIQQKSVRPIDVLTSLNLINQKESTLQEWADVNMYRLIVDENDIVTGIEFADSDVYTVKRDLIRSQRVFAVGDKITIGELQRSYEVKSVYPDGHIMEAPSIGSDVPYQLTVSVESDGNYHIYDNPVNDPEHKVTEKSAYSSMRSTTPISEVDFTYRGADGIWYDSNINTTNHNKLEGFPTLSDWLLQASKEAYDTIGFGRVKVGDTVYFRTRTMSGIADDEKNKIRTAYNKLQLNQIIGGDTIVECVIMINDQPVSIGFLNPVGAYAKTVIISDVFKSGKKADGFFNYTTTVENISTAYENAIYYPDKKDEKGQPVSVKSAKLLQDKFDDCIFVLKTSTKIYCNKSQTEIPHIWHLIMNDKTIDPGQLYLIPYSSSESVTAKPIALIYGMQHQSKEGLRKFLNDRFNFDNLIAQAQIAAQSGDNDQMQQAGQAIRVALNDTFYIRDTDSNFSVTVASNADNGEIQQGYLYIVAQDQDRNPIPGASSSGVAFSQDLRNNPSIDTIVDGLLDVLITEQNRAGIRISPTIIERALTDKNNDSGVTLYSYIQHEMIQTNAVNIRTSNAHVILHSDSLDELDKNPPKQAGPAKPTKSVPPNATNVKGDTYQPKTQLNRSYQTGGASQMHSGGAEGSDSYWDEVAEQYGIKERHHYYYGKKTPKGNHELTEAEYEEGLTHVQKAHATLKRGDLNKYNNYTLHLLSRNWFQIKNAKCAVAIAEKFDSMKIVSGGTGWAVQMAIDNGIPVYVYNQNSNEWFAFDYSTNQFYKVADTTPVLSDVEKQSFAAVGTRKLDNEGKNAINNFMAANFGGQPATSTATPTPAPSTTTPTQTETPAPAAQPQPEPEPEQQSTVEEPIVEIDLEQQPTTDESAALNQIYQDFKNLVQNQDLENGDVVEYLQNEGLFNEQYPDTDYGQYNNLVERYQDAQHASVRDQIEGACDKLSI